MRKRLSKFRKRTKSALLDIVGRVLIQIFRINSRVVLVGDGRSGTTWIAEVLNFDENLPVTFEPLHGRRYLTLSDDRLYPTAKDFARSSLKYTKLISRMERETAARRFLANPRVLPCHGFMIKDISTHLILKQVYDRGQSLIFIIRNPVSVALSKERFGTWQNSFDMELLTTQSPVLKDLSDQCSSLGLVGSEFLSYILTWCLLNRIALSQLEAFGFPVVFYENLRRAPEESFENVFRFGGQLERFTQNRDQILEATRKKSRTTGRAHTMNNADNDDSDWSEKVSVEELSKAYQIVQIMGLYEIYQDALMPRISSEDLISITSRWR